MVWCPSIPPLSPPFLFFSPCPPPCMRSEWLFSHRHPSRLHSLLSSLRLLLLLFRISVSYVIVFYFLIFTPLYACSITVVYLGLEICFIELIYTIYGYYNLISTVDIPAARSGARDISSGKEPWRFRQRHTVFVDSKTRQNQGKTALTVCCCPVASVVASSTFLD